jgi:Na+/H+ antiporter NhaA
MALFFLVVGLEIKYEIRKGELSDPASWRRP